MKQVISGSQVGLIEAGGGFGKSVLVDQVVESVDGCIHLSLPRRDAVHADWLKALILEAARPLSGGAPPRVVHAGDIRAADLLTTAEGRLLIIDNASSLTDGASSWLAGFAAESLPDLKVIVSSRALPNALSALEVEGAAVRIDSDHLRLSPSESRSLVEMRLGEADGERLWSALHHFSGGWVALLALVLRRLEHAADRRTAASELLRHPALIAQLIDHYLSGLSGKDRARFVQLGHFPVVNGPVADALGSPGLLQRVSQAGIPLILGPDGWWRLSTMVKEHVTANTSLDPDVALRAAPILTAEGAEVAAAELLVASGDLGGAAACVARIPTARIDAHDPRALIRLIERLGSAADAEPRTLLHLARVYGNVGKFGEERELVDRALSAVQTAGSDDELAVEIEAESLFHRARAGDRAGQGRIEDLLGRAASGSRGRARLLEDLGVVLSNEVAESALRRAENAMRQAALLWVDLGERTRAASAQRGLVMRVLYLLGKFDDAVQVLQRLQATSETPYDRMLCLAFEARTLAHSGRHDRVESVVDEGLSLAGLLEIPWMVGYSAWTRMLVAANREQVDEVSQQLALAEVTLGQLTEDVGGVQFLCEAADACATVGLEADALRLLAAAEARRDDDPHVVAFTVACCNARRGEGGAAIALGRMLSAGAIAPGLRWKAELLRGYAALAADDLAAASEALRATLDHMARLGDPDRADRRERRTIETLRSAVASSHPSARRVRNTTYEVMLLGRFEVRRNGEVLVPPAGRPAELIKWAGLAGGRLSVERVVELLWPDEPPGVGRRRLRNVLLRSRAALGPMIERHGEHLNLVDCTVDLGVFQDAVRHVALHRGEDRVAHARLALARYTGPLLPDDIYDDMVDHHREAVRRDVLSLIDVILTADLHAGAVDDALVLLQAARENDPVDQERPLRVARALIGAGRDLEALGLARQTIAVADQLEVPAAAEWVELDPSIVPDRRV